jgi:hypothetical protein
MGARSSWLRRDDARFIFILHALKTAKYTGAWGYELGLKKVE